jgi:hypothetical protein
VLPGLRFETIEEYSTARAIYLVPDQARSEASWLTSTGG